MPVPTPDQLRAALRDHPRPADAFAALGTTKAGVYLKRAGQHTHPDLVAILREHAASAKVPRSARGEAGKHRIALPPETVARLDAIAAARGSKRPLRSRIAREMVEAALRGPLPPPEPGGRSMGVVLDLGAAWTSLGAKLKTKDPQRIAGVLRAILARGTIDRAEKGST